VKPAILALDHRSTPDPVALLPKASAFGAGRILLWKAFALPVARGPGSRACADGTNRQDWIKLAVSAAEPARKSRRPIREDPRFTADLILFAAGRRPSSRRSGVSSFFPAERFA